MPRRTEARRPEKSAADKVRRTHKLEDCDRRAERRPLQKQDILPTDRRQRSSTGCDFALLETWFETRQCKRCGLTWQLPVSNPACDFAGVNGSQ